ncbi:MAG: tyrosine-type recombinase/integrase [Gammaproteobacteria bacterium]|nr:tyrosine-type recombinase/integrase [Alphaproteobacteria bacterium]MDE0649495.1 tyrosine-type recombinase/integrase [Gammaproteobacteria bacterium]
MTKRNQLTATFCKSVTEAGRYQDGGGLMLIVKPSGGKSWIQRLTVNGRRRDLGLGSFEFVTLAEARDKAFDNRRAARTGRNPVAERSIPTFAEAVEKVIALHRDSWKGDGSEKQWRGELAKYAMPVIGAARVDRIATADVLAVVLPHWNERTATMSRLRGRLKTVFDWCIASGYRSDNPAGEAVTAILPKCKPATVHRRALPHAEVAAALASIRGHNRAHWSTKAALEFAALTAGRSNEVTGAQWTEIDLEARLWTVPASRMKKGRTHRVPLSGRAVELLQEAMAYADTSGLVFPSSTGRQIAGAILSRTMKDMGLAGTPHGLRSAFADWAAECTDADRETIERALAHVNGNATEAAYRRTDRLDARRDLMDAWATYLAR